MSISSQGPTIQPGVRNSIRDLLFAAAKEFSGKSSGGYAHQQHMIEAHSIETVFQGENPLNFVRLDHGCEQVANTERSVAFGRVFTADKIGDREQGAKIVGGVTPLGGQPRIVEVEPTDQSAYIECRQDWIEDMV